MADRDGDGDFWARVMSDGNNDDGARALHLAQIDAYVAAWQQGVITVDHKRYLISEENKRFYGPGCPRKLIWP